MTCGACSPGKQLPKNECRSPLRRCLEDACHSSRTITPTTPLGGQASAKFEPSPELKVGDIDDGQSEISAAAADQLKELALGAIYIHRMPPPLPKLTAREARENLATGPREPCSSQSAKDENVPTQKPFAA